MSPPPPAPPELVRALLREAGLRGRPEALAPLGVSTSRAHTLDVGGAPYVVRWRLDGDPQMAHKEVYLSGLLRRHAVPAPETLAAVAGERGVATLSTRLPGVRLDVATGTLPEDARHQAWRSAGEALRRDHEVAFPQAGELVGDRVAPFLAPWGSRMTDSLATDLRWLQAAVGGPTAEPALLERVAAAAPGALHDAPVRLLRGRPAALRHDGPAVGPALGRQDGHPARRPRRSPDADHVHCGQRDQRRPQHRHRRRGAHRPDLRRRCSGAGAHGPPT